MAEIQINTRGGNKRIKAIPRIDLTPMVDLGFLLIAFFMFTTTLANPHLLQLQTPHPQSAGQAPTIYPEEATLVLIPTAEQKVAWYKGKWNAQKPYGYCSLRNGNTLRTLLYRIQEEVRTLPADFSSEAHKLHVIIRPDDKSRYEDLVAVLDEMAILNIPYYTITDITGAEQALLSP